jgi:hypothetical protein
MKTVYCNGHTSLQSRGQKLCSKWSSAKPVCDQGKGTTASNTALIKQKHEI